VPDGYWYINPALKRCKDGSLDVQEDKAAGEMLCWKDGADRFDGEVHDPTPCGGGDAFGWVTWDNLDLDRDGTFEFKSGDLVPSGTQITMDWAGGPGGTHCFHPYKKDIDGDGAEDVPLDDSFAPVDRLPPIHTPPYHPGSKARFGPVTTCTPTAAGVTAETECSPGTDPDRVNIADCGKGANSGLCEVTTKGTCAGGT
jgi:hypothetical protein